MYLQKKLLVTPFIFLLFCLIATTGFNPQQVDYLTLGKQAAEKGNYEIALKIWLQGKAKLTVPNMQIGNAFIELVARKKLSDYYEFATLMYSWGLSAEQVAPNKDELKDEIERVSVLTGINLRNRWRRMLKEGDPLVYKQLLKFWKQEDPTPTTGYNERLIEHWQRIAYAHEHFTRNKSGVFHADDRAEVYVRYGPPDYKKEGSLFWKSGLANAIITDIANTPLGCNVGQAAIDLKVREASNSHKYPEYEVWVYKKTSKRAHKNIFVFGSNSESAGFQKLNSIEDLIPNRAFSLSKFSVSGAGLQGNKLSSCIANVRPGLVLQVVYYQQLATIDPYFGDMFDHISQSAVNFNQRVTKSKGLQMKLEASYILKKQKLDAPRVQSTIINKMVNIPLDVYQYRLLDDNNNAYFATIVQSEARQAFLIDFFNNYKKGSNLGEASKEQDLKDNPLKYYNYTHTAQLYDTNNELAAQVNDSPIIVTDSSSYTSSVFVIPSIAQGVRQVFSASLQNEDPHSSYSVKDIPFKKSLRGLGKIEVNQKAPLSNNTDQLQMGDLILGYNYREEDDTESVFLPFTLANDKKISINKDIVVHFEIYHMRKNSKGIYNVKFSYQIEPKKGLLSWLKKQKEDFKLTLNLESENPRYIEDLQIKTRVLEPDVYVMHVTAEDDKTGQKVERSFEFEIANSKNE